jgi:DNA repair and recombination RAD54-like protein
MIRRTSSVLQALLPAKVEQVVFCKMSPLQQRLYSHFLNSPAVRSTLAGTWTALPCLSILCTEWQLMQCRRTHASAD